jgi:hypothetical protein
VISHILFLFCFFIFLDIINYRYVLSRYPDSSVILFGCHKSFFCLIGGAAETPCPYKCVSDRYRMPYCYTALEELIYTFGGPWLFGLLLSGLLILLALVLMVARMKFVGTDELPGPAPTQQGSQIDHSFPFLESLNEVLDIFICSNP